jgi:hypothetical protein
MDTGPEAIEDAAELARVRRQARKVYVQSAVVATALTALVTAIPLLPVGAH